MLPTFRRKKLNFCRSSRQRAAGPDLPHEEKSAINCALEVVCIAGGTMKKFWVFSVVLLVLAVLAVVVPCLRAGETKGSRYQVLAPIRNGNLTIFPVVSDTSHDTSQFLTLDDGLKSGDVVVTEAGSAAPLIRPRRGRQGWQEHPQAGNAEVNKLVLINNSK